MNVNRKRIRKNWYVHIYKRNISQDLLIISYWVFVIVIILIFVVGKMHKYIHRHTLQHDWFWCSCGRHFDLAKTIFLFGISILVQFGLLTATHKRLAVHVFIILFFYSQKWINAFKFIHILKIDELLVAAQ